MPIKGLTTQTQFGEGLPRIAKLYKGSEKPENGNRPGADLNYFRVEIEPQFKYIEPVWKRLYGDKPTEFTPVFLAASTTDEAFANWKEEWNSSQTLIHRCDGDTQVTHFDTDKQEYDRTPIACAQTCGCKSVGRLSLILPQLIEETGLLGTISVVTHSLNDILTVYRYLSDIERLNGSLTGISFVFGRTMRQVSAPKQVKKGGEYQNEGRIKVNKSLFYIHVTSDFTQRRLLPTLAAILPIKPLPVIEAEEGRALLGSGGERRMGSEPPAPKVQTAEPPPQTIVDEHGEPVIVTTTPPAEPKANGHVASATPTDEPKNVQTLGEAIKAAVQPKLMETATPGAHKQMPAAKRGNPYSKIEGGEK